MRSSRKRVEDERQRVETVEDTRRIYRQLQRKVEGDVEGKTDGGMMGRLGYLQITSQCDRFLWRLNWARGLRGNQSKS